jgi:glycosyltransferase involved in cell wall biosynthesis
MRILVIHNAYRQPGGEDAVVRAELELLRQHGQAVQVYRRSNDELVHRSAARAAMSAVWSRQAARDIDRVCAGFQPDVVHVHNTFLVISPSVYWAAARRKAAVVQTLHNFRLLCPQGTFLRARAVCDACAGRPPWRAVVHQCYRNSAAQSAVLAGILMGHAALGTYEKKVSRFIALSGFARDRFIAGGLPAQKIRVKPNFVERARRPCWGSRRGGLFVGRLSEEKGITVLLEAMRILERAEVQVVGDGPWAPAVAESLGGQYMGYLDSNAVAERMQQAAFLVLPSIGHEQMPMTVLQAFASGMPVIASRLGALTELVEDGITGLLAEPGNATDLAAKIAWAHAHPDRIEAMGRAARAEYENHYTASINYTTLMDIYEDAIEDAH